MTFIEAFILGLVQGITEFFPVSSSTHLTLIKDFLKIQENDIFFDLICHLGTTLVTIFYLRREIISFFSKNLIKKNIFLISLALLPLVPGYLLFKPLRILINSQGVAPLLLIFTGALLIFAKYYKQKEQPKNYIKKTSDYLIIGSFQSLSLIPGISRSGATISSAYFRNWSFADSVKFSFLLSIPTTIGGTILELAAYFRSHSTQTILPSSSSTLLSSLSISHYLIAFGSSLFFGLISGWILFSWKNPKSFFNTFGIYCLLLGIMYLLYLVY